jgi:dipeptidase E
MRLYLSSYRLGHKPEELLALLAGRKRTALIANAADFLDAPTRMQSVHQSIEELEHLGLDCTEVDLRRYFGKPHDLAEVLSKFDLIWARGGNTFILRRALRESGADQIIKNLLSQDAVVYGGYSAGIDMLVPSLHGIELVDDPYLIPEGYPSPIIWEGLGLLPYVVAPHYKSDHPESADIDKSVEYLIDHHLLFMALRDGEAIVVNGDNEMVVG